MFNIGDIGSWQGDDGQWRLFWVLAIEPDARLGKIYSLAQFILLLDDEPGDLSADEVADLLTCQRLGHFPLCAARFEAANALRVGFAQPQADDLEGYRQWRVAFERGEAGVFDRALDEIWPLILQAMSQGSAERE